MSSIILHQIGGISVGIEKDDGYLNATKLCNAYNLANNTNKRPVDWLRTARAQEYIAFVSRKVVITTELLVVTKAGNTDQSGTWIHPDLGNAFASWLSVEYEYEVSRWVQEWRERKTREAFPNRIVDTDPPQGGAIEFARTITGVVDILFAHLEPELRTGIAIEGVCKKHPELREALEPHKPKLLLEAPLLSPTEIGQLLTAKDGIKRSAQAVNKLLVEKNLQIATGDKKLPYKAIGQGLEFSKVIADTASGHGKTIQSLRWYESVCNLLS